MADDRHNGGTAARGGAGDDGYQQLRRVAALGFQARATLVAGDRFLTHDDDKDRETAGWLVSCAVALAEEAATDIDGFAKSWKPKTPDPAITGALHKLRMRAHQLQAATRAADHFLDQDNAEDRSNGSWLVATALSLADKLAGETEDLASAVKRNGSGEASVPASNTPEAAARRAAAAAAASVRGATVQ